MALSKKQEWQRGLRKLTDELRSVLKDGPTADRQLLMAYITRKVREQLDSAPEMLSPQIVQEATNACKKFEENKSEFDEIYAKNKQTTKQIVHTHADPAMVTVVAARTFIRLTEERRGKTKKTRKP